MCIGECVLNGTPMRYKDSLFREKRNKSLRTNEQTTKQTNCVCKL